MSKYLLGLLTAAGTFLVLAGTALADNSVTVSPSFESLSITANQPSVGFTYTVTNNDPVQTRTFSLSTSDFGSLNESGGVAFLGTTPGQLHKYGLVKWLDLNLANISIGPGQTKTIQASIRNDGSLAPGGHYGAILLTQTSPATGPNSQNVIVHPVISTLLFVAKLGGEKYGLRLEQAIRDSHWWQTLELNLRFYNSGNIDEVPRGLIKLLDPLGREVARGAINEESARILPETYRSFSTALINTHHLALPGRYRLVIQYRYEGQPNFTTASETLWYFNVWGVVLISVTAILLIISGVIIVRFLSRK